MATLGHNYTDQTFRVIHPLNDIAEQKCISEGLGRIEMTPTVRIALKVLRAYSTGMTLLLVYHVMNLAGLLPKLR